MSRKAYRAMDGPLRRAPGTMMERGKSGFSQTRMQGQASLVSFLWAAFRRLKKETRPARRNRNHQQNSLIGLAIHLPATLNADRANTFAIQPAPGLASRDPGRHRCRAHRPSSARWGPVAGRRGRLPGPGRDAGEHSTSVQSRRGPPGDSVGLEGRTWPPPSPPMTLPGGLHDDVRDP